LSDSSSTVDCRLLIIADGQAAASFVDAALLWEKKSEVVGVLNSGFVQSESQFPPKSIEASKSCTIHRLLPSSSSSSSVVVVRNTAHVYPEQLYSWHRQLFSRLTFDAANFDVVVLTSANIVDYLESPASASHRLEPPFLRSLFTKPASDALTTDAVAFQRHRRLPPLLETPNIVAGVAASTLTSCQLASLRAAAFIVFAAPRLEAATIEAFAPLLAPGGCLHGVVDENPAMKDFVKDSVLRREAGSLLYT